MRNNSLLYTVLILTVVFGTLHFLADVLYLYWTVWWFDNLMHFLGGLTVGLLVLWVLYASGFVFKKRPTISQALMWSLAAVVVIGGLWEVFEYITGITQVTEDEYYQDTVHDLIADAVGAVGAAFVGRWPRFYPSKDSLEINNG